MAKNSIRDYSATAASNTDIQSVDIDEGCSPSGINNAIREVMADLKDVSAGTVALESPDMDALSIGGTTVTATAAELNYVDGVTSNIQTQIDGISSEVVDDTTPQLGGNLDLNSNDITGTGDIDITGTVTADGLTVDTNTLHVDATNNRVGIGTSSPTGDGATLHLDGSNAYSTVHLTNSTTGGGVADGTYVTTSGNDFLLRNRENGYTSFYTNNTERMRLTSDGKLSINGTGDIVGSLLTVHGSAKYIGVKGTSETLFGDTGSSGFMGTYSNHNMAFRTNNTDRLTIESGGAINFTSEGGTLRSGMDLRQGSAKHWIHFNGSNNSVKDSYNHTSISDNGTGDFQMNVNNDFNNDDFTSSGHCSWDGTGWGGVVFAFEGTRGNGYYRIVTARPDSLGKRDMLSTMLIAHGDLA